MDSIKKDCCLCGVPGETETYWDNSNRMYKLRVICKNPMCIGNRLNLENG